VFGFGLTLLLLLGGAELALPGWLGMFIEGLGQYHRYVQNQSLPAFLFGLVAGRILGVISVLACAACLWNLRREPASSAAFGQSFALVLALTVVVIPMLALYNQVLLAPAILALVRSESLGGPILSAVRLARVVGGVMLVWPWIATLVLDPAYVWLTPEFRLRVWTLPFYSSLLVPIFVLGLALLDTWPDKAYNLRYGTARE